MAAERRNMREKGKAAGEKEKATAFKRFTYGEDRWIHLVDRRGTRGVGVKITTAHEVWDV